MTAGTKAGPGIDGDAQRMALVARSCRIASLAALFAWVLIVLLSNVLFTGTDDVTASTGLTVCLATGLLSTWLALRPMSDSSESLKPSARILLVIGIVLLTLVPIADGFVGHTDSIVPFLLMGLAIGVGLALTSIPLALMPVRQPHARARETVTSAVVGCVLFLATSAFLPQSLQIPGLVVLSIVALATGIIAGDAGGYAHGDDRVHESRGIARDKQTHGGPQPDELGASEADEAAFGEFAFGKGLLVDFSSSKLFPAYAVLSGFLLGYWYNIYPKTTHFAGSQVPAAVGSVSLSSLLFLVVLSIMAIAMFALERAASPERRRVYAGSLVIVVLAATYFSLPLMPQGTFGMLMSMAVLVSLPVAGAACHKARSGDMPGALAYLAFIATGTFSGALVAMGLIEITRPESVIVVPVEIQTVVIIGLVTVALTAEAVVAFAILSSTYYPAPLEMQVSAPGSTETTVIAGKLSEQFHLTPRECEILELLLIGRSGSYISEELCLSKSTVKTHIRHIYAKMNISSKQQLIDLAQSA